MVLYEFGICFSIHVSSIIRTLEITMNLQSIFANMAF